MGIRELSDIQEGLEEIELTGDEARTVYKRIPRIIKHTDTLDVI